VDHAGVDERVVEFEPLRKVEATTGFPMCGSVGEYYKKLGELISAIQSKPRVAVLGSEDIHSLPVTVAVNIAISLAQQKQKVLMVDTDTTRNTLAQVFELDPALMQKKVQSSCLENLSACSIPAEKIELLLQKKKLLDRFDTFLIYAPGAETKVNPNHDIFFFGDGTKEMLASCNRVHRIPGIQSILK